MSPNFEVIGFLLPEIILLVLTRTSVSYSPPLQEGNNKANLMGTGLYGSRVKAAGPKKVSSRLLNLWASEFFPLEESQVLGGVTALSAFHCAHRRR